MTDSRSINRIRNRNDQCYEFVDYRSMYDLRIRAKVWSDVDLGGMRNLGEEGK